LEITTVGSVRKTNLFSMDVSIVIPVFNQLAYTRQCLESLGRAGVADGQIIIINNASTDGTAEFLTARPEIRTIHNPQNRGCGFAWTQGAKMSGTTWTIVMNNDVLVPLGCLDGLISFAEDQKLDIVSPAICEGDADYDFPAHAADFMRRLKDACRRDVAHGVAFMVHRRVFDAIGYFDGDPKLGGYEDDEFFRRARDEGFCIAITGRAFLHHFGSITQKSIQSKSGQPRKSLGDREYYRRKTGQTWFKRKIQQVKHTLRSACWKRSELKYFGRTLWEKRVGGRSDFF
jgi:N-acetylglucosaminyl-diphospho-decaprenol L-rhamnosyltransferase